MHLKNKAIDINPDDIFKNDLLNRKPEIENISEIIIKSTDPLTISINGAWGTGKTTFVRLLTAYLNKHQVKSIYISAWDNDFEEDPFLLIMRKFLKAIHEGGELKKELKETAIEVLKIITSHSIKALTKRLISEESFNEVKEGADEAFAAISGKFFEHMDKEEETLVTFKKKIHELIKEVGQIVIVIDELDRCRPDFSIKLLERIKHLFDIEGLTFILSTDRQQLGYSFAGVYGEKFNGSKYLERIIDIEYELSNPADLSKFWMELAKKFDGQSTIEMPNARDALENHALQIINIKKPILRDIEKFYCQTSLVISSRQKDSNLYLLVMLSAIRTFDENLYIKIKNQKIELKELISFFKINIENLDVTDHKDKACSLFAFSVILAIIAKHPSNSSTRLINLAKNSHENSKSIESTLNKYLINENITMNESSIFFLSTLTFRKDPVEPTIFFNKEELNEALNIIDLRFKIEYQNLTQISSSVFIQSAPTHQIE